MLFEVGAAHRKVVFDGAGGHIEDGRYLLDAPVFEVKKGDGGLLLLRQEVHGAVELLVSERCVCGVSRRDGGGSLHRNLVDMGLPAMVDVAVVGDAEEPGAELGEPEEGAGGDVRTHEGVLGDVVREAGISTAQRKQEPPKGLLLLAYKGDEPLLRHALLLFGLAQGFFFRLYLRRKHFLTHEVADKEGETYGQQHSAGNGHELAEPDAVCEIGQTVAYDCKADEGEAHEGGDAGARKLVQQILLDALDALGRLLRGLEVLRVYLRAALDCLEHDLGFPVGLVLLGAVDNPYDGHRQHYANENGDDNVSHVSILLLLNFFRFPGRFHPLDGKPCQKVGKSLIRIKNLFHQLPLLVTAGCGGAALELGHIGFPLGLSRQHGQAGHIALEVEVITGVHNHKEGAPGAIDLHLQDAHLVLAGNHFRPHMGMRFAVFLNHRRVVNQREGLAVTFHILLNLILYKATTAKQSSGPPDCIRISYLINGQANVPKTA